MLVEITKDEMRFDTISRKGKIVDSGALAHRQAEDKGERTSASLR